MTHETFPIQFIKQQELADSLRIFTFARPDNQEFNFIPGQFINLYLPYQGETLQRSYSIASPPTPDHTIEIAVSYVEQGRASNVLFNLKPGDEIPASGPFGRLLLKEEDTNQRYILIATGTGVAPYRAMKTQIKEMLTNHPEKEVVVILGVRTIAELLYYDEFAALADELPNCKFYACTSREQRQNPSQHDYAGRVSSVFDEVNFNCDKDIVYLCGNPEMVDDTYKYCTERGFTFRNVRREKYVFSK